jgi:hypothetical protein
LIPKKSIPKTDIEFRGKNAQIIHSDGGYIMVDVNKIISNMVLN